MRSCRAGDLAFAPPRPLELGHPSAGCWGDALTSAWSLPRCWEAMDRPGLAPALFSSSPGCPWRGLPATRTPPGLLVHPGHGTSSLAGGTRSAAQAWMYPPTPRFLTYYMASLQRSP